jgi:hypothetical protein
VFVACSVVSLRNRGAAWLAVSLAALLGLNGALHLLATVAFGRYSPGTATGVLLYLPLGAVVLRAMAAHLPSSLFARGILVGILAHAAIAVIAFA